MSSSAALTCLRHCAPWGPNVHKQSRSPFLTRASPHPSRPPDRPLRQHMYTAARLHFSLPSLPAQPADRRSPLLDLESSQRPRNVNLRTYSLPLPFISLPPPPVFRLSLRTLSFHCPFLAAYHLSSSTLSSSPLTPAACCPRAEPALASFPPATPSTAFLRPPIHAAHHSQSDPARLRPSDHNLTYLALDIPRRTPAHPRSRGVQTRRPLALARNTAYPPPPSPLVRAAYVRTRTHTRTCLSSPPHARTHARTHACRIRIQNNATQEPGALVLVL